MARQKFNRVDSEEDWIDSYLCGVDRDRHWIYHGENRGHPGVDLDSDHGHRKAYEGLCCRMACLYADWRRDHVVSKSRGSTIDRPSTVDPFHAGRRRGGSDSQSPSVDFDWSCFPKDRRWVDWITVYSWAAWSRRLFLYNVRKILVRIPPKNRVDLRSTPWLDYYDDYSRNILGM